MNARQIKKCLKRKIDKLQSDNNLMRKFIADTPQMQKLYDLYNRPLNVTHTTMPFIKYEARRLIPTYLSDDDTLVEMTKQSIAEDLLEGIKENITYEIGTEDVSTSITGSIFIGRK